MGATFNPFTGTIDFTGTGGGGAGTPAAPDTSVQFNDGGSFGGDADLTWDKTTNRLQFTEGSGVSFDGVQSPITMVGGSDDGGSSAILLSNAEGYCAIYSEDEIAIASDLAIEIFTGAGDGELSIDTNGQVILVGAHTSAVRAGVTAGDKIELQARDVDGADWSVFGTLLSGNTPSFTIAQPTGGSLLIKPPTTDPHVAGALWNNSGLAMISSG